MNEIINNPTPEYVAMLLNQITELEDQINSLKTTLAVADSGLKSWRGKFDAIQESVEALCHEHLDNQGTMFFDGIVDLFDIELTRTVTIQYKVSFEVQATVPAHMTDEDVEEGLTIAKLDYEFLGNGDIEIEDISFGDMEVE